MKPKAKKFRTRGQAAPSNPTPGDAAPAQPQQQPVAQNTKPKEPFALPTTNNGDTPDIKPRTPKQAPQSVPGANLDEIRKEGLTGRQLRMARRTAQRHGLAATSDFDAVRLLREKGIDPFQRSDMLELVKPDAGAGQAMAKIDPVKLPQTVKDGDQLPSTDVEQEDPALRRQREVQAIQKDIVRRRQRRMALLMARLAFFVGLPSLICGIYFYNLATPMYATKSSFLIQQNDAGAAQAGGGGLGGMLGGGMMATVQDSIAVQGYLTSQVAMIRLDEDLGFKAHFSGDEIDPLTRLAEDSTNQEAFKIYKKNVKIGYDPTEGIINMEVIAASPEVSEDFSHALISYAEERVDNLTQRLREDQMAGARESFREAELARQEALDRLVRLQADLETADPVGEIANIQGQVSTLETELNTFRIQLAEQLENRRPNQARVESLRSNIRRREEIIDELNRKLTSTQGGELSAAEKQAQLRVAEADFTTRDLMLQNALQALETARVAADRQARYLAPAIVPVAPDEATYPRKFENTILAVLIFGGIYLMMSLTASILREQV